MGKDLKGKELGQGLSQRKDGLYCYRYTDKYGKRRSIYKKTLGELRAAEKHAIAAAQNSDTALYQRVTLDEWFETWLQIFKPHLNSSTKRIYRGYYKYRVSPVLGEKYIDTISEIDIRKLFNQISKEGYKDSAIEKTKKILSEMYRSAISNKYATDNPLKNIKLPKSNSKKRVKALSREEQQLFLRNSTDSFYHNTFLFQLYTGLRPGELFGLKTSDIDLDNKIIHIQRTLLYDRKDDGTCEYVFHSPKTPSSSRKIPISKHCEEILKKQLAIKSELASKYKQDNADFSDLLFTNSLNKPLNTSAYNSAIKKIIKKINKDGKLIKNFSGHNLRHTFASRCFESGIQSKTIQEYLGHNTLQITMDIYTHIFNDFKAEEIQKLDNLNEEISVA